MCFVGSVISIKHVTGHKIDSFEQNINEKILHLYIMEKKIRIKTNANQITLTKKSDSVIWVFCDLY